MMKKAFLILSMVFSIYATNQAVASTITIDNVESWEKGKNDFYTFDLTIDGQTWSGLKTTKQATFTTQGGVDVTKQGQATKFDKNFMDGGKKGTWAYRMDITLYQTQSGEWDWCGTVQRWDSEGDKNKKDFTLTEQVTKPVQTPLPNAAWLLAAGLLGLLGIRKRISDRR